jgi:predicted amidohydrolase
MLALTLLVLNHVTVIDVARGVVLPESAIEIEGPRIRAVLAAARYHPPAGSEVQDLRGRYVLPGFIDMHAHVLFPPLDDDGRPLPWFDRDTSRALLRTLHLHGVTTVRDPGDATYPSPTSVRRWDFQVSQECRTSKVKSPNTWAISGTPEETDAAHSTGQFLRHLNCQAGAGR